MKITIRQAQLIIDQLERVVEQNEKRLENIKGNGYQLLLKTSELKTIIANLKDEQCKLVNDLEASDYLIERV